ncbi:MAG TPA: hypothetical protein VKP58_14945 [Candidatus Acidoferrum sp.]|nr:hypothetical protein [Candidatus Acidoferrum sp.]
MSVRTQVPSIPSSDSAESESQIANNRRPPRCTFSTSDNRRCTMFRHDSHPSFCLFHARQERILLEAEAKHRAVASVSAEFHAGSNDNRALSRLLFLLIEGRISSKNAARLAQLAAER